MDLWLPLQADPASTNQGHYLAAAARLDPGVSIEQARAAMKVLGERFRAGNPKWMDPAESVAVVPMKDSMVEDVRLALLILLGAVGFVLLIACANVANLLLARAAVRQKELAIRAALGASRWRVVRQLLTESLILAGAGAVLGFAIGAAGVRALLMVAPGNIPRLTQTEGLNQTLPLLDWRVAAFTIGRRRPHQHSVRPVPGAILLQSRPGFHPQRGRAYRRRHAGQARALVPGGYRSGPGAGAGDRRHAADPHFQRLALGEPRARIRTTSWCSIPRSPEAPTTLRRRWTLSSAR